jgi:hypothetical protein
MDDHRHYTVLYVLDPGSRRIGEEKNHMAVSKKTEETTTLDSDTTKPSVTAPGDGPADTTDPTERASTVTPQPGPEALKAGTVNGVVPLPKLEEPERDEANDRTEEYEAVKPDGSKVTVVRNIETGESRIK